MVIQQFVESTGLALFHVTALSIEVKTGEA
jgi:hypothetical protein